MRLGQFKEDANETATIAIRIALTRHKGLRKFYETGSMQGIVQQHATRLRAILAKLDASKEPQDMDLPGLRLHLLRGNFAGFWGVSVSGNWRVVFRFEDGEPTDIDYLDYH